ncbi:MAG: SUMF1/EgtB/PvdO family nonheme iron enzyme [Deltaproteobacteria bacterium]|nr:SUMF1/EgtB/PvdO family nonheme iron enzyme [Deltaproteobacteria bacterium]
MAAARINPRAPRRVRAIVVGVVALGVGAVARAAPPESVSAESRAQVTHALHAVEPAYAGKSRKVPASNKGSLEMAIASYAPPRPHPVEEGTLPPVRSGRCPQDMVAVASRFCVDKYEGSLLERLPDGSTRPFSPYQTPASDGSVYIARSVPNVVPQGYISGKQAGEACRAAGKRLCHPSEWRVACAGSEGTAYPYGPSKSDGRCHDSGATPMMTYHADTMKRGWGKTELNDPRNNQLEGGLAKTGAYPECVNDWGAYDMVGNLHEWTADPNGTFQGGYWLDTSQHGDGCAYRTIAHAFDYHDYSTGFRCCADLRE